MPPAPKHRLHKRGHTSPSGELSLSRAPEGPCQKSKRRKTEITVQDRIIEADAPAFSYPHHIAYCDFLMGKIESNARELTELREKIVDRSRNIDSFPGRRAEVRKLEEAIPSLEARERDLRCALRWANEFAQA